MADTFDALPDPQPGETTVGDWTGVLPKDRDPATRQHRRHQGEWRANTLRWPAGPPQRDERVRARYPTLPNWLARNYDGKDAYLDGPNLMSDEARAYTPARLAALGTIDGKAEPDRLWRNLLSSQPMAFSIAGHLRAYQQEAAVLLGAIAGFEASQLDTLVPADGVPSAHAIDGVEAEWFPPRRAHTNDMSGADIATCLSTGDGTRVLLTVEVKYTDSFSSAPVLWSRYQEHLEHLGLDEKSTNGLVEAGCSQVLRQVMMTHSVRRLGISPNADDRERVGIAVAAVLARHNDDRARGVVKTLDDTIGSIVPVRFYSHTELFDQAATLPKLRDWAHRMTERYVLDD